MAACKAVCFVGRFGGEDGQHEENRVHLGNAIMSFYSALIDLLGRCAPEMHVSSLVAAVVDWLIKEEFRFKKKQCFLLYS